MIYRQYDPEGYTLNLNKYHRAKTYNSGGFFENETDAYNYMWKNTMDKNGNVNSEQNALITENGVWVFPNAYNLRDESNNYLAVTVKSNALYVNGQRVLAWMHTHPELEATGAGGFSTGYDDRGGLNKYDLFLVIIEFDNNLGIAMGDFNQKTWTGQLPTPENFTRDNLLNGSLKLIASLIYAIGQ